MSTVRTIEELYDTDPLLLTDQDIDLLVSDYRGKRAQFLITGKQAGKVSPAKPKATGGDPEKAKGILAQLGLNLGPKT